MKVKVIAAPPGVGKTTLFKNNPKYFDMEQLINNELRPAEHPARGEYEQEQYAQFFNDNKKEVSKYTAVIIHHPGQLALVSKDYQLEFTVYIANLCLISKICEDLKKETKRLNSFFKCNEDLIKLSKKQPTNGHIKFQFISDYLSEVIKKEAR